MDRKSALQNGQIERAVVKTLKVIDPNPSLGENTPGNCDCKILPHWIKEAIDRIVRDQLLRQPGVSPVYPCVGRIYRDHLGREKVILVEVGRPQNYLATVYRPVVTR